MESQFPYCPLTWMFHITKANSKISHINERSLRIVNKDNVSSFVELQKKDKSFCIHHINMKSSAIDIFKVKAPLKE